MHALLMILRRLRDEEKGATMVEYGLMLSLIVLAALAGLTYFSGAIQQLYQGIANDIVAAIH
ncbi:Flp family type IVb pilin [Trinickia symbiotica]|uniref:Flp family type IVb pilin n=1 Tax=Trinickia symbiotica TaxID=863227 RepID=A0A2T3XUR7_9BURK|nr:Flp family type IVb pilin [Trinickia symbiotica]PTB20235.1 Flp family type IVb pilin [Trinickia symbiotica]